MYFTLVDSPLSPTSLQLPTLLSYLYLLPQHSSFPLEIIGLIVWGVQRGDRCSF